MSSGSAAHGTVTLWPQAVPHVSSPGGGCVGMHVLLDRCMVSTCSTCSSSRHGLASLRIRQTAQEHNQEPTRGTTLPRVCVYA